jgi:hypothetical protein
MSPRQLSQRQFAYVKIAGPGRHEAITELLGIEPANAWNIGDTNPRNGKPRTFMLWDIRSGLDDTQPLEQHVDRLLDCLSLKSDVLPKLWLEYDLVLQCVGYYPINSGPGIHLSRDVIRRAAQFGLSVDYDFYYVEDHGHDG